MLSSVFEWVVFVCGIKLVETSVFGSSGVSIDEHVEASFKARKEVAAAQRAASKGRAKRVKTPTTITLLRPHAAKTAAQPAQDQTVAAFAKSVIETPVTAVKAFVQRPLPSTTHRPVARLRSTKKRAASVKRVPDQTRQSNRPLVRARSKVAGKTHTKRVVWIETRSSANGSVEIVDFPGAASPDRPRLRAAA